MIIASGRAGGGNAATRLLWPSILFPHPTSALPATWNATRSCVRHGQLPSVSTTSRLLDILAYMFACLSGLYEIAQVLDLGWYQPSAFRRAQISFCSIA